MYMCVCLIFFINPLEFSSVLYLKVSLQKRKKKRNEGCRKFAMDCTEMSLKINLESSC